MLSPNSDRKSTRLNSSHGYISYAVFCLKKKIILLHMCYFFFFNDTATTEIYTLSLHDALPISDSRPLAWSRDQAAGQGGHAAALPVAAAHPGRGGAEGQTSTRRAGRGPRC